MSDENQTQDTQDTQDKPVVQFGIFRFSDSQFGIPVPIVQDVVTAPTEPIPGLEWSDAEPEVIDPDEWNVERKMLRWWSTANGADLFGPGTWGVAKIPQDDEKGWLDALTIKRYEVTQPRPEIRY